MSLWWINSGLPCRLTSPGIFHVERGINRISIRGLGGICRDEVYPCGLAHLVLGVGPTGSASLLLLIVLHAHSHSSTRLSITCSACHVAFKSLSQAQQSHHVLSLFYCHHKCDSVILLCCNVVMFIVYVHVFTVFKIKSWWNF